MSLVKQILETKFDHLIFAEALAAFVVAFLIHQILKLSTKKKSKGLLLFIIN
jgi:hypothetical protein